MNQRITFLDQLKFLSSSLSTLFEAVKTSCSYYIIHQSYLVCILGNNKKVLRADSCERLQYLIVKGSFPYELAKSVKDYSDPHLVSKKQFCNAITRSHITEEKYKLAEEIWYVFDMKCMKDYMEIYCMCHTIFLAKYLNPIDKSRPITLKWTPVILFRCQGLYILLFIL